MKQYSFYFYDLETSGFNPRSARPMQFAGQRTDMDLKPVGEPHNFLIKMSEDVLPDPDAVLVTGITPQATITDGLSEAEFLKIFHKEIAEEGTIFVGFNTVRFDDEFMRFLHYRNFYDAYEWQWKNNRSRWDILDLVRLTRALRPDGIKWPVTEEGNPTNKLELIAELNNLQHDNAHDALSDVMATIDVAKLIKTRQPKLFDFLLKLRNKKEVAKLVYAGEPFVYASGKYANEFEKTTVVGVLAEHPQGPGAMVFDLRYDPEPFLKYDPSVLAEAMKRIKDTPGPRLPAKTLKFNRCPAIAPLSVLDQDSQKRLKLDMDTISKNYEKLLEVREVLGEKVVKALNILDKARQKRADEDEADADARLYEGFFSDGDRVKMGKLRELDIEGLARFNDTFDDDRLSVLLPLYKARNYPGTMSEAERDIWDRFKERKLVGGGDLSRMAKFFKRLSDLDNDPGLSEQDKFLLEELQLYAQSIMPLAE